MGMKKNNEVKQTTLCQKQSLPQVTDVLLSLAEQNTSVKSVI
jgi:hypothetical protein